MTNNIPVSSTCAIHEGISGSHLQAVEPLCRSYSLLLLLLLCAIVSSTRPLLRCETRARHAALCAGIPMISVLFSMPFLLKFCPSISFALFACYRVGIFTELSTKAPNIHLPTQNSSFRAHYCVRVHIYLELVLIFFFSPAYFAFVDIESQLPFSLSIARSLWSARTHSCCIMYYNCTLMNFNLLFWPACPFFLPPTELQDAALILLPAASTPQIAQILCSFCSFCCVSSCAL